MIRAMIVDDEPLARRGVRVCLGRAADVAVVGEADSGMKALKMIQLLRPDVVFLDVQMPGMNGFEMLSMIEGSERPFIVFLTAYDDYAVSAFGVRAVDYVMKPLDDERFDDALRTVRQRLMDRRARNQWNPAVAGKDAGAKWEARLKSRSGGKTIWIDVDEIDWIEASGDYVTLHVGPRLHMIHASMDSIERRLDPCRFVRIHRSSMVPLNRVHGLSLLPTRDALMTLRDGTELRVSRRFRHRISLDGFRPMSSP
ncbi:LytR/AlgR family response regulator transcription factor [Dyella silvae]|uniref:LytR/AlgR family response regulator transcription factor n=1 Tax=Dyella silvae TaxID=2994424 RepID=UPI0022642B88|nr:LytTR family DNA-binding domain-containing protein [Dyella silvae]